MKILQIVILCIVLSCNQEIKTNPLIEKIKAVDSSIEKTDSYLNGLYRSINFLDSNIKYTRLFNESKEKMLNAESDYYRTGDNRYYKRFYKYQKEANSYVHLANRYYDSLKSSK